VEGLSDQIFLQLREMIALCEPLRQIKSTTEYNSERKRINGIGGKQMRGWGEEGEDNSKNASKLETKGRTDWQQCTATDEMGARMESPPVPSRQPA